MFEHSLKNAYIGEYRVPGDNTVLYYSFNNDTASTSFDGVGSNNGTWNSNSGIYDTVGGQKCTQLTTTSSHYMTIPTSVTYPTTNFTISFWVKYSGSDSSSKALFSKWNGSNGNNAYLYIYQVSGKIQADIPYNIDGVFSTSTAYNDNNRHHVCLTKSGTTWTTYVDTSSKTTKTVSTAIDGGSATTGRIGKNNNDNDNKFSGYLDEFIIEDVAWTAQEVSDYYNSTKSTYGL